MLVQSLGFLHTDYSGVYMSLKKIRREKVEVAIMQHAYMVIKHRNNKIRQSQRSEALN